MSADRLPSGWAETRDGMAGPDALWQRHEPHGQPRRGPSGWMLVACVRRRQSSAGLTWLAVALAAFPGAGSASPAAVPFLGRGTPWPAFAAGPTSPPVRVCGNKAILGGGPSSPPKGAVVIPAGDDSGTVAHNWTIQPHTTYWFAPGKHTLGTGQFSQIIPADGDTFIGAPGAVLDGQHANLYAFTRPATT